MTVIFDHVNLTFELPVPKHRVACCSQGQSPKDTHANNAKWSRSDAWTCILFQDYCISAVSMHLDMQDLICKIWHINAYASNCWGLYNICARASILWLHSSGGTVGSCALLYFQSSLISIRCHEITLFSITRQPQPGCLQFHQITSRDHVIVIDLRKQKKPSFLPCKRKKIFTHERHN